VKALGWTLLALALFLATLAISFPAALAWKWFAPADAAFELTDVRGSIWHGGAAQVHWRGRDGGALSWRVRPLALLTGRVDARLRLDGPVAVTARVVGGLHATELRDVRAEAPSSRLADALSNAPLAASGRIRLDVPRLALEAGRIVALSGEIQWQEAAVRGAALLPLGRLRAPFVLADGPGVRGSLHNEGGAVAIEGSFSADPWRYRVQVTLAARDPRRAALLQVLGQPLPDGRRRLVLERHAPPGGRCLYCW
jgi:general secretion pathway protein N